MRLIFLGTRACIEARSARHARHSALLIGFRRERVLIDCGEDWLDELAALRLRAIVLTHAHPDHAGGLRRGASCPVWATEDSWQNLGDVPVAERRLLRRRAPVTIGGLAIEAFAVEHSLRAPAVGLRISGGRSSIFYAPDLADLPERTVALRGVGLYIGDGTALQRSMVRREEGRLCGHASVDLQLGWCREASVPRMIVTHCGTDLVTGEPAALAREVARLGEAFGVRATVAWDGMQRILR